MRLVSRPVIISIWRDKVVADDLLVRKHRRSQCTAFGNEGPYRVTRRNIFLIFPAVQARKVA
jgi:hypothetical protein